MDLLNRSISDIVHLMELAFENLRVGIEARSLLCTVLTIANERIPDTFRNILSICATLAWCICGNCRSVLRAEELLCCDCPNGACITLNKVRRKKGNITLVTC